MKRMSKEEIRAFWLEYQMLDVESFADMLLDAHVNTPNHAQEKKSLNGGMI